MKHFAWIVFALSTVGCATSPFPGAWYESDGRPGDPGVVHIAPDHTFASGHQSKGQPIRWETAGTWKLESETTISMIPQDGTPHPAKLAGRDELIIVSPDGAETYKFGRTPRN